MPQLAEAGAYETPLMDLRGDPVVGAHAMALLSSYMSCS
jgi:hypothetical protein